MLHCVDHRVTSMHKHCDPHGHLRVWDVKENGHDRKHAWCLSSPHTTHNLRHLMARPRSKWRVMRRACMGRRQYILTTKRRKMAGHILRLRRERSVHTAMDWMTEYGRRKRGRSEMTWISTFKEDLEDVGVNWHGSPLDRQWPVLRASCHWPGAPLDRKWPVLRASCHWPRQTDETIIRRANDDKICRCPVTFCENCCIYLKLF